MTAFLAVLGGSALGWVLLLLACRPDAPEDVGPWRFDPRYRGAGCSYLSSSSEAYCTRLADHRGRHDDPVRPDSRLLERS